MIARRLREIARAMAAIANDCEPDDVKALDYVPEPLRDTAYEWSRAMLMSALTVTFAIGRLNDALRGDRDD